MFNFTYSERSKPVSNLGGYNDWVGHIFHKHPHIYRSTELLRVEHAFRQHKAEETFVYIRKLSKTSDNIDAQLVGLLEEHTDEEYLIYN